MTLDPPDPSQAPVGDPPLGDTASVPQSPPPTIHEAELESGVSGRVRCGTEIDFDIAVARRRTGGNVVVCGDEQDANRRLASRIEGAVGPCLRADPHIRHAGPHALPHYQQKRRVPAGPGGHTFYETIRRKARRTK
jgi:hypothetical protein